MRTPFGRHGGALASVRADDLAAIPLRALMARHPGIDLSAVDDGRNVARKTTLLAGLPLGVAGTRIRRLCGSGLDAVGSAARAMRAGEAHLMLAGGLESMRRAPFVRPKAESAFSRSTAVPDPTIGWRFINKPSPGGSERR